MDGGTAVPHVLGRNARLAQRRLVEHGSVGGVVPLFEILDGIALHIFGRAVELVGLYASIVSIYLEYTSGWIGLTLIAASEALARGSFQPGACGIGVDVLCCVFDKFRLFSISRTCIGLSRHTSTGRKVSTYLGVIIVHGAGVVAGRCAQRWDCSPSCRESESIAGGGDDTGHYGNCEEEDRNRGRLWAQRRTLGGL